MRNSLRLLRAAAAPIATAAVPAALTPTAMIAAIGDLNRTFAAIGDLDRRLGALGTGSLAHLGIGRHWSRRFNRCGNNKPLWKCRCSGLHNRRSVNIDLLSMNAGQASRSEEESKSKRSHHKQLQNQRDSNQCALNAKCDFQAVPLLNKDERI